MEVLNLAFLEEGAAPTTLTCLGFGIGTLRSCQSTLRDRISRRHKTEQE